MKAHKDIISSLDQLDQQLVDFLPQDAKEQVKNDIAHVINSIQSFKNNCNKISNDLAYDYDDIIDYAQRLSAEDTYFTTVLHDVEKKLGIQDFLDTIPIDQASKDIILKKLYTQYIYDLVYESMDSSEIYDGGELDWSSNRL